MTYVYFQFLDLSDAMYKIDFWGNATLEFKKKLLFSIQRLQQPIVFKIGKMSIVNVEYYIVVFIIIGKSF